MTLALLSLALVCADGGTPTDYAFAPLDDRAQLERSEWRIVSWTGDWGQMPKSILEKRDLRLVFRGDKLTFRDVDFPKGSHDHTFKLYPHINPKGIDWTFTKGIGSYHLEKDTLKIAFDLEKRPQDFTPCEHALELVLRRVPR